uniref:RING-CH-type domain-containing protein n=1 Tax=Oryza glumipatula TaxID=40148 RepID=A0A0D9YDC7_9ORYZ
MADHFALMAGRLLTESTLQSAVQEALAVASVKIVHDQPDLPVHEDVQDGKAKSGVMVECRICQEEVDESYMETPCCCKGSLKARTFGVSSLMVNADNLSFPIDVLFLPAILTQQISLLSEYLLELVCHCLQYAHHACIQRWCNEKGDTVCEICLQQFTPNYTAPLKLFRHGRNLISFRRSGERSDNVDTDRSQEHFAQTSDQAAGTSSFDSQNSSPKGVFYCRVVAISLMALLVLRDAISLILGDPEVYSIALFTLLMIRTAGIVIPIYIILVSVTTLLHRYRQHQAVHEATESEPGGGEGLRPMPPPQHVISIQ